MGPIFVCIVHSNAICFYPILAISVLVTLFVGVADTD